MRHATHSTRTRCTAHAHARAQEQGAVYKCLASRADELDAKCQRELGRAYHMALFVWQPGAILTTDCDPDVKARCLTVRPNMAATPGAVAECLAGVVGGAPCLACCARAAWPCAQLPGGRGGCAVPCVCAACALGP